MHTLPGEQLEAGKMPSPPLPTEGLRPEEAGAGASPPGRASRRLPAQVPQRDAAAAPQG